MSDEKCPQCGGAVEIVPWPDVPDEHTRWSDEREQLIGYRSAAAEQLEHVKTISQSMAEENDKLHAKLADKELVLEDLFEMRKDEHNDNVDLKRKLTAANAVIETAHKKLQEWAETDESFVHTPAHSAAESAIEILSRYIDKLQGGDGDEREVPDV